MVVATEPHISFPKRLPRFSAEDIRGIRIARGMTQTEAAELFGVKLRTWARYEENGATSGLARRMIYLFSKGII
jgi:transcriptional regulator with XRE-family HTH domain